MIAPWRKIGPFAALSTALLLAGCGGSPRYGGTVTTQPAKTADDASLLRVADHVAAAGNYTSALSFYQTVLSRSPGDPRALAGIGGAQAGLGRIDLAVEAFSRALAADPGLTTARLGLANSYIASGRPRAALVELERVIAETPDNAKAYNTRGVALDLLGRSEAAQLSYGRGLDLAPGDRNIGVNLALSFAIAGNHETGIALLRDIARQPGADAKIRQNLALAYGLAGDLEHARAIAGMDLTPAEVAANLAFYAEIRGLEPRRRAVAVILGPDFVEADEQVAANDRIPGPRLDPAAIDPAAIDPGAPPPVFRLYLDRYQSREQALVAWTMSDRLSEGLLAGLTPDVREVKAAGDDPHFQLEVAFHGSAAAARDLCDKLVARGMRCHLAGAGR